MLQQSCHSVLSVLKLCNDSPAPIPLPPFAQNQTSWLTALNYAVRWNAALPWIRRVQLTPWHSTLAEKTRLLLDERFNRDRVQMAVLDTDYEKALRGFSQVGVSPVTVGGMDWGRRVYSNRMDRPMERVEFLVRDADWFSAVRGLGKAGFRISREGTGWNDLGNVRLYRFGLIPGLWSRVNAQENTLSVEDSLLFSMITRGGFWARNPLWLTDLAAFLKKTDQRVDWKLILILCEKLKRVGACWSVLEFLDRNWGVSIPDHVRGLFVGQVGRVRKLWLHQNMSVAKWFPAEGKPRSILRADGKWQTARATLSL